MSNAVLDHWNSLGVRLLRARPEWFHEAVTRIEGLVERAETIVEWFQAATPIAEFLPIRKREAAAA